MPPKRRKIKNKAALNEKDVDLPRVPNSAAAMLAYTEITGDYRRNGIKSRTYAIKQRGLISMLRQREFRSPEADKAFACKWLDNDRILVGTKDNKLLEINVNSKYGNIREIPRPIDPPRNFSTQNTGWGSCGIHSMDITPSGDLLATGGTDAADCVVLRTSDYSPVTTLIGHRDWLFGNAWVSDRHLVTGSRDRAMALWTINPDENIGLPPTVQEYNYHSPQMKKKYEGKVREVKYDRDLRLVVGLGTEGVVKLHDPNLGLRVLRTLTIPNARELVSMAVRQDLVAVGGLSRVCLLDPRKRDPDAVVHEIASPDPSEGIRSICISNDLVSFGTGKGKIAFFDLRASNCLSIDAEPGEEMPPRPPTPAPPATDAANTADQGGGGLASLLALSRFEYGHQPNQVLQLMRNELDEDDEALDALPAPKPRHYLETGPGWVQENATYFSYFGGRRVHHACYAHAWDPSGTRLFACGGPLAFGLSGGYMALWE